AGRPIPAAWALAWAQFHPEIHLSTPARRCPEEFTRLFVIRYQERYGDGMTVRPNKTTVRLDYRAASAGIGTVSMDTGLPDVFGLAAPAKKFAALVSECTEALDPFSRWLGRNPNGRGSLAAAALLPTCLVDPDRGRVADLLRWADSRLGPERQSVVDGTDLVRFWSHQEVPKLTRTEAIALAKLLGGQGFGIEPDPRFGGAAPNDGPAVLFRTDPGSSPCVPSTAYTAAATLLHLAVAVAGADDEVSDSEQAQLVAHLRTSLHLTPAEQARMEAHLRLLLTIGVKLTGLTRRLGTLSSEQREQVALFCVRIAAADGTLAASEMATLTRIYKLLGLDPAKLPHDAHAEMTAQSPLPPRAASGPVTVRPAGNAPSGYAVPPQRHHAAFHLDETVIAAKLAETEQVSALLGQIFTEDPEPATLPAAVPTTVPDTHAVSPAAGLDRTHSALLRALADRPEWTRVEFEDLCADLGLLPDGALDTLNDAAFEVAGEPVAEGDDPIEINTDAMQEMLT
ncbi:MAG TPA: tellurite resistance TerB C-terminal domain-containing protein, partial [Mycobacteriales bacterium]